VIGKGLKDGNRYEIHYVENGIGDGPYYSLYLFNIDKGYYEQIIIKSDSNDDDEK